MAKESRCLVYRAGLMDTISIAIFFLVGEFVGGGWQKARAQREKERERTTEAVEVQSIFVHCGTFHRVLNWTELNSTRLDSTAETQWMVWISITDRHRYRQTQVASAAVCEWGTHLITRLRSHPSPLCRFLFSCSLGAVSRRNHPRSFCPAMYDHHRNLVSSYPRIS